MVYGERFRGLFGGALGEASEVKRAGLEAAADTTVAMVMSYEL